MLNAVNAHGKDQYQYYNPVVSPGTEFAPIEDQVDGTGALDAYESGKWVNSVRNVRSYPSDHPNKISPRQSSVAYFWMVRNLTNSSGTTVKYLGNSFNAGMDFSFDIKVPALLPGRHLRVMMTWQPITRTVLGREQVDLDDFDISLMDANNQPLLASNDYQGTSWENNVETIDWTPAANQWGTIIKLKKVGSPWKMAVGQTGKIRTVIAWEWVKSQTR